MSPAPPKTQSWVPSSSLVRPRSPPSPRGLYSQVSNTTELGSTEFSRRGLLQLTGTFPLGTLAGCTGQISTSDDDEGREVPPRSTVTSEPDASVSLTAGSGTIRPAPEMSTSNWTYEGQFPGPDYHSHVGLQLDRGFLGPLIVEERDPHVEYDREYVVAGDDYLPGEPKLPSEGGIGGGGGIGGEGGMMGDVRPPYEGLLINDRLPREQSRSVVVPLSQPVSSGRWHGACRAIRRVTRLKTWVRSGHTAVRWSWSRLGRRVECRSGDFDPDERPAF